jgi:hypothetical protein
MARALSLLDVQRVKIPALFSTTKRSAINTRHCPSIASSYPHPHHNTAPETLQCNHPHLRRHRHRRHCHRHHRPPAIAVANHQQGPHLADPSEERVRSRASVGTTCRPLYQPLCNCHTSRTSCKAVRAHSLPSSRSTIQHKSNRQHRPNHQTTTPRRPRRPHRHPFTTDAADIAHNNSNSQ